MQQQDSMQIPNFILMKLMVKCNLHFSRLTQKYEFQVDHATYSPNHEKLNDNAINLVKPGLYLVLS